MNDKKTDAPVYCLDFLLNNLILRSVMFICTPRFLIFSILFLIYIPLSLYIKTSYTKYTEKNISKLQFEK